MQKLRRENKKICRIIIHVPELNVFMLLQQEEFLQLAQELPGVGRSSL